jgi:DnaJ-class molecular chaperone
LGILSFTASGSEAFNGDKAAMKRLEDHHYPELQKVEWVATRAARSGNKSRLAFKKVHSADEEEGMIAEDLFEVLGVTPDDSSSVIKRKYRRLSIASHPDKCPRSEKEKCEKRFDVIRQAYEVLYDADKRAYYNLGGMRLVRNIETGWKEIEGQKAQLDAQLNQVPHNHPMRAQVEMQVAQQKQQLAGAKGQIEKKMVSEDQNIDVPVTLSELFHGTWAKKWDFPRLVICKGCRADPTTERCLKCGRCPPEKKQIPQFANTPFGRQVTGHKDKLVESLERCRHEPYPISGLKVTRGARPGTHMKTLAKAGHQAPGKLPGTVHFKLKYADDDTYVYAGEHLYTVLTITLSEALYGFTKTWRHVSGKRNVTLKLNRAAPGDVVRISKKGMFNPGASEPYGDIIVRIEVELPKTGGQSSVTVSSAAADTTPRLARDTQIEVRDNGDVWRHYVEAERAISSDVLLKKVSKDEL